MNAWKDDYIETNGIRLHYHRTGGDKPPLVLAHGITDNGLCWSPLARALEADYDLILVDARGHGLSDKPESGHSAHDHADDLAGLIRGLGLVRPVVIGHSMGGSSAAMLAYTYPELVSRLILEDPGWRANTGPVDEEANRQRMREREENFRWRQSVSLEEVTAATRRANPRWSDDEFPAHSIAKHQVSLNVMKFGTTPTQPWWEIVPSLQCPVLVITGDPELGAIITEEQAQQIHELNPRIEVVRLAEAGHNVRRDQFSEFLRHVRRFLSETP